jgi:ribulose-phosphate 3-epimerase
VIDIAPSILSADVLRLGEQVLEALEAGARRIHVDVMDGHFVPNLSMGSQVVRALRPLADRFGATVHVHLMITDPDRYLGEFARAGAHGMSVHVETCPHLHRTVQTIRDVGARPGVALNPATPLIMLEAILSEVDLVLVMSVEPGFGGQEFIPYSLERIAQLREMLLRRGLGRVHIAVDGGVHIGTIAAIARAGATIAVAGSAVFGEAGSVAQNLEALRRAAMDPD